MKLVRLFAASLVLLALAGCRSRVIKVRMVNSSSQPVSGIIVDYPGATFGVSKLAPGQEFRYAFKPLDNGKLKIEFTNASGKTLSYPGPLVHKDDEGGIEISFSQEAPHAEAHLSHPGG
jgi:hypothetical protein